MENWALGVDDFRETEISKWSFKSELNLTYICTTRAYCDRVDVKSRIRIHFRIEMKYNRPISKKKKQYPK